MTIYKQMEYQMRLPGYETLAEGKDGDYTYMPIYVSITDKRWTTQEVIDECLRVIEQFRSFEEK